MGAFGRRPLLAGMMALGIAPTARGLVDESAELTMVMAHTGERFSGPYRQSDGRLIPEAKAEIDHLLRDWRTGSVIAIDPLLLDMVASLSRRLGGVNSSPAAATIYSGYRTRETNSMLFQTRSGVAWNSYHILGRAIDIRFQDQDFETQATIADDVAWGGLGVYGGSGFLHLDTGPVRRWGGLGSGATDEDVLIAGLRRELQPRRGDIIHRGGLIDSPTNAAAGSGDTMDTLGLNIGVPSHGPTIGGRTLGSGIGGNGVFVGRGGASGGAAPSLGGISLGGSR